MAEVTYLDRGWKLYSVPGKGWDLISPNGQNTATWLQRPIIDELNAYTNGFEAGRRVGMLEGHSLRAERTSQVLKALIDGDPLP